MKSSMMRMLTRPKLIFQFYYEEGKNVSFKVRAEGHGETTANSDYTSVSVKHHNSGRFYFQCYR